VLELETETHLHQQAITSIARGWRPDLLAELGVGPIGAATVLGAWSHPGRCRSEAAFAMLAGAAPIPASSGQTVRHRLRRSGDRQLNQALHTIVLTRLRCPAGWAVDVQDVGKSPVTRLMLACGQRRHHRPSWAGSLMASIRPCGVRGCLPAARRHSRRTSSASLAPGWHSLRPDGAVGAGDSPRVA
jgi:Transposase IS116/IS110/IS902 family